MRDNHFMWTVTQQNKNKYLKQSYEYFNHVPCIDDNLTNTSFNIVVSYGTFVATL